MQIVHGARMAWGENLASHRQGGMAHKLLFEGEEGSPDNFAWVLADEGADYFSPRHRHAWDQVRLCLEGSIPISKGLRIEDGEVGYFPEGAPYGPQEGGPNRKVLVLQFGGASGLGYLSARQLREARTELGKEGVFEGGVFHRTAGEGKANLDAYEAIWRHVTGRPIDYPKPRYKTPVILSPAAFDWRPNVLEAGVEHRHLAMFVDRGLTLMMTALRPGAVWRPPTGAWRRLVFVRSGQGQCNGQEFEGHSAIHAEPMEDLSFHADADTELFEIWLRLLGRATT